MMNLNDWMAVLKDDRRAFGPFCDWAEEEDVPFSSGYRRLFVDGRWPGVAVLENWYWGDERRWGFDNELLKGAYDHLEGYMFTNGIAKYYRTFNEAMRAAAKAYDFQ